LNFIVCSEKGAEISLQSPQFSKYIPAILPENFISCYPDVINRFFKCRAVKKIPFFFQIFIL